MVPISVFVQAVPDHYPMLDLMVRSLAATRRARDVTIVLEDVDAVPECAGRPSHKVRRRPPGFAPHGTWERSTLPDARCLAEAGRDIGGDDWMLRTDCDVVFLNAQALEAAAVLHTDIGIAGCEHDVPHQTQIGEFRWMSGSCMFIRGRYLHALDQELRIDPGLDKARSMMERDGLPMVCDVALSYIAMWRGAARGVVGGPAIPKALCACDDVAGALTGQTADRYSLVHYGSVELGGERVGKWGVPARLAAMGLDRWRP